MKRYKYLALLVFMVVILSIVCFHGGISLKERVTPPSKMWGRNISLGITDFKKIPSMYTEGSDTIVAFADEKGFRKVRVDREGSITDRKIINIKDYIPRRLVDYQLVGNKLFWTENYDLFYSDIENSEQTKHKLLSEVLDFQLLETGEGITIATSTKNSICFYDFSSNGLVKPKAEAWIKSISYLNAAEDSEGNMYIAGVSKINPSEYKLSLLSYDISTGSFVERVEPVVIENFTSSQEGSNSINNLELGFDKKEIYVFYEIGKASSQGMVAKTYMGRVPKDQKGMEKLTFEKLNLDDSSKDEDTYISSLMCLDTDSDKLNMIITTPVRTSIRRKGTELVSLVMDQGKIIEKNTATNTGEWNTLASIRSLDGQYVAVFLQTIGTSRYTVSLTSTNEGYKANLNRTTMNDIKYSVMDTVGAYVFSFFTIFINLFMVGIILLWPLSVEFFEWRYFLNRPLATFRIGVLVETFMMYFSISIIYKNEQSVALMPDILKHGLAPIGVLLITAVISYLVVHLYRKSKENLHGFPELALFILVHNIFIYFLYTAYIARF